MPLITQLRQSIPDALRHSQVPREWLGRWLRIRGSLGGQTEKATSRFLKAYYHSEKTTNLAPLARRIQPVVRAGHLAPLDPPRRSEVSRTLLVKAPGPDGERGVILSYFEYNWHRLLHGIPDWEAFSKKYTLVLLPSWSPTNYEILAHLAARTPDGVPLYLQPANHREREKLATFHQSLRLVDGLACDWVHPRYFEPLPWEQRDIDLLVVSNWAPFKRHWELFHTLSRMPANLRVTCVGQPDSGKTLADIRALQRSFRAPQSIEYLESIPIDQVTALQCRAKVSALFSRWEGGCVAAVETLMAGAVLAMRDDARIGARAHVNSETGVTFLRHNAPDALMRALETGSQLNPRQWAIDHISSDLTMSRLNEQLKSDSLKSGLPWTEDLAAMCYRPYLTFSDQTAYERLAPAAAELHDRYPLLFAEGWLESAKK
ncbi:MAG: glycosyltransferase [Verrucomicrobiae bacterium]|nr:glycosyltransferase [Verrucomicrobiae bacterium]